MSLVLVINSGSSSLKYQVVDPVDGRWLARGLVERIGQEGSLIRHEAAGADPLERDVPLADHAEALESVLALLDEHGPGLDRLVAVGHRVVHGGSEYREPAIVDDEVEDAIARLVPLAPLHNPAALVGLRDMRRLLPSVPQVAVFDTAFHAGMPAEAYTYALPVDVARAHRLRKYGFHGTSYAYVTRRAAGFLGVAPDRVRLIICHLGNGASMAAVRDGVGIDTSMGLTPLQGLVMGTRSGDVDPAVVFHLMRAAGLGLDDVDALLNKQSGLKGLAGDQDMREVRRRANDGDQAARLALDVYAYRVRAYIGAYLAVLPGVQALVFTAGIGENDAALRQDVCDPLRHLGIALDTKRNAEPSRVERAVDDGTGPIRVLVIPTDEEAEIARQAMVAVAGDTP
ncbi:MAG: acetate kinase [Actinomycetota bacterium]|nr:acetate kinase [Actinomycetota bacterium]